MIRHCVFLNLSDQADPNELAEVLTGLSQVCDRLPGASNFVSGPNRDFENKTPDYPMGFTVDFADPAALDMYAADPEHQAFGARLVALCRGGADGITVFDIDYD